jgi:hypothetical protein
MMESIQPLQKILLGKVITHLQKTETRSMSITLYWYQLKVIKDLNIRPKTLKLVHQSRENSGSNRYRQGLPQ